MDFPLFNTLKLSDGNTYDLNDPAERRKYFQAKLGPEIDALKEYLDNNTFVGFLLAKKQAGKGTYSKMFEEIVGSDRFTHISVGDTVRNAQDALQNMSTKKDLLDYIYKHYRGFIPVEEAVDAVISHTQDKLIPTELILVLLKFEIEKAGRKGLFIDGLPRNLDQVSYSLYFRDLINFREDPDFFVLIDVPESLIQARMEGRVICPVCHTSRHIVLNPTKFIRFDKEKSEYYLVCDNSSCSGFEEERMVGKIGDDKGIELIRERLDKDAKLMEMATTLYGIPRVLLNSSIPVTKVATTVEEYELQDSFVYQGEGSDVTKYAEPFVILDDEGNESNVLEAATVVLALVSQIYDIVVGNKKE